MSDEKRNPAVRDAAEQPIKDEHKEFAAALVSLSRHHGAELCQVTFMLTGGRRLFKGQYDSTRVSFAWSEGRHGERSRYSLRAEAHISVKEPESDDA